MQGRTVPGPPEPAVAPLVQVADAATRSDPETAHRLRLVGAMAAVLAERPYSTVTIADIARQARVSKRTFYEHFADKEACFIACYATLSEVVLQATLDATAGDQPWEKKVRASTRAYLATLESQPALTRTLMMDIYAAGPEALRVRRDVQRRFADQLRRLVAAGRGGRKDDEKKPKLSEAMATAVIGGINELVLVAVEEGRADRLTELAVTADALVQAVLRY
jgi:AcrR family transcriptional regulator